MEHLKGNGVSPIFATLILVVIAVIAGCVVYMFTSGALSSFTVGSIAKDCVKISPFIYSPHDNIGVLNEQAMFNITIKNPYKENLQVTTQISYDGNGLFNNTRVIAPESTDTESISQKLSYTGLWA